MNTLGVLRWEDPPPPREATRRQTFVAELVAIDLKRHPNRWAVVAEAPGNTGLANMIQTGRARAFQPPGSFEAVGRSHEGVLTIYARFVGEVSR